jgi:RNA polymerase sigma factor (sigma-70 family)
MPHDTLTAAVRRIYRDAATRSGLSDADLLARFAATRDEAAFEVLVWRHEPMVLGVCRRVLGNPHDAEDAFQTTFVALASRAGSVRSSLAAWLYQVAHHAALRLRKDRARRATATLPPDFAATEREENEAIAALDEELQRLPRKYRDPLVLAYLQGHSNQQVADALGCPIGTIFTRLSRGRERLRAALARRGVSLAPVLPIAALGASQVRAAVLRSGTVAGASLAGGALALATAHKLKSLAAALLLVGFVAVGMFAAGPAVPTKSIARVGPSVAKNDLPEGAVARLGTMKFRHAGADQFAVRADGKTVVTGGHADTFRTWDLATGKLLAEVKRPKASEREQHLLLPDGKTFARVEGKELTLIDTTTGKRTGSLKLETDKNYSMTASPDGTIIAINEGTEAVGLYTLATGKRVSIPLPQDIRFAFSPDDKLVIVSAGGVRFHTLHEVASGKEVQRLKYPSGRSVFSPDGKTLYLAFGNGAKEEDLPGVVALDTKTWKPTGSLRMDKWFYCTGMAVSPDGKTLGANFGIGTRIIDTGTIKVAHRFRGQLGDNVGFTVDSKKFIATTGNRLRVWDVASGEEFDPASPNFVAFRAPEISPDGKLLATTGRIDGEVTLWDLRTAKLVRRLPLASSLREVMVLRFGVDSKTLFAATADGFVQTWRVADGKGIASYQLKNPPWKLGEKFRAQTLFMTVTAQPGGKRLSVLEAEFLRQTSMSLSQWDIATGKRLTEHVLLIGLGVFSPDGSTIIVPGPKGLKLLDVPTGETIWHDPAELDYELDASPDFRLLAGRKDKKTITVWETRTGKVVSTLATGPVGGYTLTWDNRAVVTLHENRLRVWDLATGKEVLSRIVPPGTYERTFAVLPDGQRALTRQGDGTVLLWDIARPPTRIEATPKELAAWWADLASPDAARVWGAAWKLADARAVATLRQLRPAVAPDPAAMRKRILRLNADTLAERDAAERELSALGEPALPFLRPALEKFVNEEQAERLIRLIAGARTWPQQLRRVRAVAVLERIGTAEAIEVLREVAGGADAPETAEAAVALRRLGR